MLFLGYAFLIFLFKRASSLFKQHVSSEKKGEDVKTANLKAGFVRRALCFLNLVTIVCLDIMQHLNNKIKDQFPHMKRNKSKFLLITFLIIETFKDVKKHEKNFGEKINHYLYYSSHYVRSGSVFSVSLQQLYK